MVAFNASILQQWKSLGYRFILVLPRDKYGVLRPLFEDKPVAKGYTIDISEMSLIQMAEDYFVTKEKDAEFSLLRSRVSSSS
jgi:predicted RNA-binding protein associated with RNAse of E/G family